jgi:hypothetical protein
MAFVVAAIVGTLNYISTLDAAASILFALLTFGGSVVFGAAIIG